MLSTTKTWIDFVQTRCWKTRRYLRRLWLIQLLLGRLSSLYSISSTSWRKWSNRLPSPNAAGFTILIPVNGPALALAQCGFHYVGSKFKRTFSSLTGRKLYVKQATALDAASVDEALIYGKEIGKWENLRYFPVVDSSDSSYSCDFSNSFWTPSWLRWQIS